MKKRRLYVSLVVLVPILTYLLWPLTSDKWDLRFDNDAIALKKEFLELVTDTTNNHLPNILLIMVDDLGMADLSLYGNGYPQTPNIDALGHEGVAFTNAYVTSPVCSPSRAAILTGRYQQRFGFQFQMHERYLTNRLEYLAFKHFIDSQPWIPKWMDEVPDNEAMSKQGLPPSEVILPELLKTKGYQTAIIGKWHLGADKLQNPCNMGFDYQYGFYASHSLYAYENTDGIHDQKVNDFTDPHIWSGQRNGAHAIYKNCEEIIVSEYLTDRFADESISYLQNVDQEPFFLYLSFNAPHTPLQAPEEYMNKYEHIKDPIKRTYYAMISNLDDNIGKVTAALERLELNDKTLIFFISDNGGAEYTLTTDNGKYKGGKITDFEGGLKVPFIINWPGMLNATRYDNMVSSMDIFQTIVELTNCKLLDNKVYDGTNLLPYLSGIQNGNPHDYLMWQRGASKSIRSNLWKLSVNEEFQDSLLYDIHDDPYETENVLAQQSEMAEELKKVHDTWSSTLPEPKWPGMIYYEFIDGKKSHFFDQ